MRARGRLVIVLLALAIVLVAVVASSSGGGGKQHEAAGVAQYQPVSVHGASLPRFADGPDPAVGRTAPTLAGRSFDGAAVEVAPHGRPLLVLFVAHWCPHCRREVPLLTSWFRTDGMPTGVDIVSVSTQARRSKVNWPPSAWLADVGWPVTVMADNAKDAAARAYGLDSFPYFVFLDARGRVVARYAGELPVADLDTALKQLARTNT